MQASGTLDLDNIVLGAIHTGFGQKLVEFPETRQDFHDPMDTAPSQGGLGYAIWHKHRAISLKSHVERMER
jgi:hypothetical protein